MRWVNSMGNALTYRSIHSEMRETWVNSPLPPAVTISDTSRAEIASVEATAVAHDWTVREVNTGDLALLAADRGNSETSRHQFGR